MYINAKDTEGLITNEQSKDTGNTGHKTQNENKKQHRKPRRWGTTESVDWTQVLAKGKRFCFLWRFWFDFWCFNATFSNISAISWRPVLTVEEAEYPERTTDRGQATGKHYHLRLRVECTLFCILQSWARTHVVLVIGLYELLDPTT